MQTQDISDAPWEVLQAECPSAWDSVTSPLPLPQPSREVNPSAWEFPFQVYSLDLDDVDASAKAGLCLHSLASKPLAWFNTQKEAMAYARDTAKLLRWPLMVACEHRGDAKGEHAEFEVLHIFDETKETSNLVLHSVWVGPAGVLTLTGKPREVLNAQALEALGFHRFEGAASRRVSVSTARQLLELSSIALLQEGANPLQHLTAVVLQDETGLVVWQGEVALGKPELLVSRWDATAW